MKYLPGTSWFFTVHFHSGFSMFSTRYKTLIEKTSYFPHSLCTGMTTGCLHTALVRRRQAGGFRTKFTRPVKTPAKTYYSTLQGGGGIPLANVPLSIIESHLCLDLEANSTHFMNKHPSFSLNSRKFL